MVTIISWTWVVFVLGLRQLFSLMHFNSERVSIQFFSVIDPSFLELSRCFSHPFSIFFWHHLSAFCAKKATPLPSWVATFKAAFLCCLFAARLESLLNHAGRDGAFCGPFCDGALLQGCQIQNEVEWLDLAPLQQWWIVFHRYKSAFHLRYLATPFIHPSMRNSHRLLL